MRIRLLIFTIFTIVIVACSRSPSYESRFEDSVTIDFVSTRTHDDVISIYREPIDTALRSEEIGFFDGIFSATNEHTIYLATDFNLLPPDELISKLRKSGLVPEAATIEIHRKNHEDSAREG